MASRSRSRSLRIPCGPKSASPLRKLFKLANAHKIILGKSRSSKSKVVRKLRSHKVSKKALGCKSYRKH